MGRILGKKIEVLVVSSGGSATTLLIEFIARYRRVNHAYDSDRLKHLTMPPICRRPDIKILYLHGDPVRATASLFRRGYHHSQSKKLQRHMRWPKRPIPFSTSLRQYAVAGEDLLFLQRHFHNWHSEYILNDTLFVRYEKLWDHLDEVFGFLALPSAALADFPAKKVRHAQEDQIDADTLRRLERMHAPFVEQLAQVPDVQLVKGVPVPMWRHCLLQTRQARCAVIGQSLFLFRAMWLAIKSLRRNARNILLKPFGYQPKQKPHRGADVL